MGENKGVTGVLVTDPMVILNCVRDKRAGQGGGGEIRSGSP